MLKINLLPVRQLKKRAQARNQLVMLLVGICLLVFSCTLIGIHQSGQIAELNDSITRLKKERQSYSKVLAKIKKLKKEKKELERKGGVIDKLQDESSITVHVMDEVSNAVDNTRVWLNSVSQTGNSLQISGIALDNRTISEFMNTLKKQKYVTQVNLTETSQQKVSNRDLKKFSLRCSVAAPQGAEQEPKDS